MSGEQKKPATSSSQSYSNWCAASKVLVRFIEKMGDTVSSPQNGASTVVEGADGEQEGGRKKRLSFNKSQLPEELTSKYEVLEKIGSGSFGSVYRVKNSKTGGIFAAKYADTRETVSEVSLAGQSVFATLFNTQRWRSKRRLTIFTW